jgi:uncharacterized protein (DUF58 family)
MRTLTGRGRALLALGVISAGAGWSVDQPAIIAVALLLILIPGLGILAVRRSRFVLGSARTVSPSRIPFGSDAEVVLTVENGSRFPSGALLLEDTVPDSLGEPTRLVLDRIPPRAQRSERYRITGLQRGRTKVGPLTVHVADPFGTARLARSFTATNSVVVTPRIVDLGPAGASMTPGGRGDTMLRSLAARGDDDLLPREHRAGDDMRRIHWRATARQGELMVRREEQAWHSSITVVLDDRERAHHGAGAASTFEWAVSAAASVAVHYLRHGWRLTVLTASGRVLVDAHAPTGSELDLVLQAFADVRLTDAPMAATLGLDTDAATAVVAVLGRVTDDAARTLARPVAGFAGCLLLEPGPEDYLRTQGWRVSPWSRSTAVEVAWQRIAPVSAGARR